MRTRILAATLILAAAALAGCAALRPEPELSLRKGVVTRGSIDAVVSVTGRVYPEGQINLSFEQPGIVEEVSVRVGDVVFPGAPLARLDTRALEVAVSQAELALRGQQLAYDRLFVPPSPGALAAAQASVDSARATYNQIAAGVDPESIRIAEFQYDQAVLAYQNADTQLRAVQWYLDDQQVVPYREAVNQALLRVEIARLRLEQLRAGPDDRALAAADASVRQAQAEVGRLLEGPGELEIAQAQVQIERAELALTRARERLDAATLRAPVLSVVAEVNVREGAVAPTNRPAVILVDASRLHIAVTIDEVDIGRVLPGQPAVVTVDALPGQIISGQLTEIAAAAVAEQGLASYEARIDLEPTDLPLYVGMTATVDIIVQRLSDVLLVPNWAIRFDRESGQAFVNLLLEDGSLQEVPVVLGLRGDSASQVIAGLEEGQTVAVSLARESLSLFGEE